MKPLHLDATTISDAWFRLLYHILDNSYKQNIQRGSFEKEQFRFQYPGVSVYISHPDQDIVPIIPPALGIPSPTTMDYIEDYFANYLMNPELEENETYRYSSRIHHFITGGYLRMNDEKDKSPVQNDTQINRIIKMLRETPLTNHAVIEIATPDDLEICRGNDGKIDPPCLRLIDFKVIPTSPKEDPCCSGDLLEKPYYSCLKTKDCPSMDLTLTVSVYFRSWDLWAGFPSNLGGIELLKQYVASECGLKNGEMYAYSSGLHIYGYQEEIAKIRTARKDNND